MNTFGHHLRLTTFGESHGPAIGGILDGFPSGVVIDLSQVQQALDSRRPGTSTLTSARREPDTLRILSGIIDSVTLGTPIAFLIENTDARSTDYEQLRHAFRPSHADFTYQARYGIRDHRGGGRASARETAARVAAGAIAAQLPQLQGVNIHAEIAQIGQIADPTTEQIAREIQRVRAAADTIGGIIRCRISGLRPGVGNPVFGKLSATLASAMLSIPAAKAFEIGMGMHGCTRLGSEVIDEFTDGYQTLTNHSGGIQGGISNGMPLEFRVGFKPIATMMRPLTGSTDTATPIVIEPRGRHDVCVLPRAIPVVEAMTALTLADALL